MIEAHNETLPSSLENSIQRTYVEEVIHDFWISLVSREISYLGRKEVLTGKAKFGILGDGKELAQVAMARAFMNGDWRAGYYRDQTFMFATGLSTFEDFFAQLYADAENDPFSGGRQMNSHYATKTFNSETGEWLNQVDLKNISSDISCTAGQMGRAAGLALASRKYRKLPEVEDRHLFSQDGNEVCFCTIGDSSTSEGAFWETMNAACVNKIPLLVAVWDDGYGISVPVELQTTKGSISRAMEGMLIDENKEGMYIYTVKGWDYTGLVATFEKAAHKVRSEHIPAMVHVIEMTQPQGHSTSGSHERYKSKERLSWEREYDCIEKMAEWMLQQGFITSGKLAEMRQDAKGVAKEARNHAWQKHINFVKQKKSTLTSIYDKISKDEKIGKMAQDIHNSVNPFYSELVQNAERLRFYLLSKKYPIPSILEEFINEAGEIAFQRYQAHLYSEGPRSALNVPYIPPEYSNDSPQINGYQVLNKFFEIKFAQDNRLLAFGEDVGKIGDVNQGFAGLQKIFGSERIFDTGIREWTIVGFAIGLAMRGLKPIAEIQYLDYIAYAFSPLTDDLATLRYRSNGIQRAPAIIRTRGHRLEGIWHAGSPMGVLIHALRGMIIAVPRNMVQAAGIYNTLIQSDDPSIVIECLNGYRLKESLPSNIGEYTIPVGMPEILTEGRDITLVTYGSCVREALEANHILNDFNISLEVIDVQTLLPFDLEHLILQSIKKTHKVIFMDEDVPGGASAYMMKCVLEDQNAFTYLDSIPVTITAAPNRTPFGSDGDYFVKPTAENVVNKALEMMKEYNPQWF